MAVGDAASLLQQLPQPGPSQPEILFRRMLLQCLQRTQHADGQADWRSDPRFHCVVESLQERLFDLEQSAADRPGPDVLQLYRNQVSAIAGELRQPDLPAYCLRPAAAAAAGTQRTRGDSAAATTAGAADTSESALQAARIAAAPRSSARDASSGPTPPSNSQAGAAAASNSSAPQVALSSGAQERLRTQQRLQDELTSELLDMGQELKASTLSMQNAIRFRGKLLDDAEVSLVDSTANAQAVSAKHQHSQGRWNFCQTLLILLAVAVIFCGMIVWIKLTSMVGLKGR